MKHNKIPKVINYCWFGGNPLPDLVLKCIESWKENCPDYKIVEWNEKNFDVNCNKFVKEAYEAKKWAFVSDYARLFIIYNNGGLYFDTDVEIIKNIDDYLKYDAFFAKEDDVNFNTGIGFGAIKKHKIIKKMMEVYDDSSFIVDGKFDLVPCPVKNTNAIKAVYGDFNLKDKKIIDNVCFLSKEFFCPIDYETKRIAITKNTVAIHHFSQSWLGWKDKFKMFIKRILFKILGKEKTKKIIAKIKNK